MIASVLTHAALELMGQGVWLCLRGRCKHRHHRWAGDTLLVLLIAVLTVHLLG